MSARSVTPALMVVGGGRMGEALVGGLIRQHWAPAEAIIVVEQYKNRRQQLADAYPGVTTAESVTEVLQGSVPDGTVIAVKPGDVEQVCAELASARIPRVLSIAAGVTIASLERWLQPDSADHGPAVVRAMPNTPALVGAGAAAVAPGTHANHDDVDWAESILRAVGTSIVVSEPALDAVTGLSGSGPAYVFLIAEALIDAGVLVGLPRDTARQLAIQTLLGSSRLLAETGEEPSALRAAVTSPGGTTAAGLRALEAAGVRNAVLDAVAAATERSRELGRG